MVRKIHSEGFTFDDVLLRPAASSIESAEASLKTTVAGIPLRVPFVSAAMDTVTGARMAAALGKLGALGVIHRNCSVAEQVRMVRDAKKEGVAIGAACGPFDVERAAFSCGNIAEAIKSCGAPGLVPGTPPMFAHRWA